MKVFFNGAFVSKADIRISPDDRGFLFADGVYEVIRCYQGRLFKTEEHLSRLDRSLREIRIQGFETGGLKTVAEKLLAANDLSACDATVYIQVTRGQAPRKHSFPDPEPLPTVYASASRFTPDPGISEKGAKIILVPDIRWERCDIKSVALLPNILANQRAKEAGAQEAVFVRNGAVTEGTHTNFCAVFGGELATYPLSNYILGGVTRNLILALCRALNIPHREFPVFETDLKQADEAMLVGTTTDVTPVVEINGRKVGGRGPGPVTRKLQHAFRELTRQG